jgi:hypothetical protein
MRLRILLAAIFVKNVIGWRTENSDVCGVVSAIAKSGKWFETRHAHKGGRINGDEQNEFTENGAL